MTLGHGQFGPKGLDWQDLCNGPLHIATYYIYKLWASRFLRSFLSFSHYKSMGANDPRGVASLGPRGLIWTTGAWLAGFMWETTKHSFILNLLALCLMVSEKKIFEGSLAI